MKKAKIFLTALTVLAVVGGALAFKAKQTKAFYQCDLDANPKVCTINPSVYTFVTTTNDGTEIPYDEFNKPCVQIAGAWTCTTLTTFLAE